MYNLNPFSIIEICTLLQYLFYRFTISKSETIYSFYRIIAAKHIILVVLTSTWVIVGGHNYYSERTFTKEGTVRK